MLTHSTPDDVYYWCPTESEHWAHFHAATVKDGAWVCEGCGVEIYDAGDGTGRYKARRPFMYIVPEEDELDLTGGQL